MSVRTVARSLIRGVSWKNPVISTALHAIDPVDSLVRRINGQSFLPPYSVRARSAGIRPDIGGREFLQVGREIRGLLETHAGLTPASKTLEIGCGCGRNAFALAGLLENGNYTGMDIERVSLAEAKKSELLHRKRFSFDLLDVRNDAYNPQGTFTAAELVLPYQDRAFDVVFMVSVFTHMLTDEVKNYARQIARVLKPGGRCLFTAYLLDGRATTEFPFVSQQHSYANETVPEIAVAYRLDYLSRTFANHGMRLAAGPFWGSNARGQLPVPRAGRSGLRKVATIAHTVIRCRCAAKPRRLPQHLPAVDPNGLRGSASPHRARNWRWSHPTAAARY